MTFGARDKDKRPIPDATFQVTVTGPGGQSFSVNPEKAELGGQARFTEAKTPGEYSAQVTAFHQGRPIGAPARQRYIVYEEDLELNNPVADLGLLAEIARETGGQVVPPEKLAEHLRILRGKGFSQELEQITTVPLWDNGWLLAIYVGLLGGEWWLRKKRGMV